jgi:amidase
MARAAETAVLRGDNLGPLHGVPVTIKDTIETAGIATTAGSKRLVNHLPADDAPAVRRLKRAGAIVLGKTNVPEMAMTYETNNPVFGRTLNPFDSALTPGGSSGGEAAAIAACLSPAGLGSDLSGSIRIPANFCGIFGLKPTAGLVASDGHIPPSNGPLNVGAVVGPMARGVDDLRLLLRVLTANEGLGNAEQRSPASVSQPSDWRVCGFEEDQSLPVSDEVRAGVTKTLRVLEDAGATVFNMRPPAFDQATALWIRLFAGAAAGYVRELYSGHETEAGPFVQAVLEAYDRDGPASPDDTRRAWAERDALRQQVLAFFEQSSFIVAPVGSVGAFPHGMRGFTLGTRKVSTFRAFGYSQFSNVFGLPAVAVPVGRSPEGLPLGVQLIGRPLSENVLLDASALLERELGGWVVSGKCASR